MFIEKGAWVLKSLSHQPGFGKLSRWFLSTFSPPFHTSSLCSCNGTERDLANILSHLTVAFLNTLCWLLFAALSYFPPNALSAFSQCYLSFLCLCLSPLNVSYLRFYYQASLLSNFTYTHGFNYWWLSDLYLSNLSSVYSKVYWTSTSDSIYSEQKLTGTSDTRWKEKSSSPPNPNPIACLSFLIMVNGTTTDSVAQVRSKHHSRLLFLSLSEFHLSLGGLLPSCLKYSCSFLHTHCPWLLVLRPLPSGYSIASVAQLWSLLPLQVVPHHTPIQTFCTKSFQFLIF